MSNYSNPPYFDDYDKSKGFHKILFRPMPVQARELNQIQTIFQEQINRLGSHFFKEGTVVGEGSISTKENQVIITVQLPTGFDTKTLPESDLFIRNLTTTVNAKVLKINSLDTNKIIVAIEYQNSDGANISTFTDGDTLFLSQDIDGTFVNLTNCTQLSTGLGFYVSVLEGVYFINGAFVYTKAQNILIPNVTDSYLVGFRVNEEIITPEMDNSLYSNASGEPNFKNPGAHRLKISLSLEAIKKEDKDLTFIEIINITDGVIQSIKDETEYSRFNEILAQRTFEESGNYTVKNPSLTLYDHIRDENHVDGLYTPENNGDESKVVCRLGRGISYVQGFRNEISNFRDVIIDKARSTKIINNSILQAQYGSYINVTIVKGLPKLDINRSHNLLDVSNNPVGTAKIRAVKFSTSVQLYLFDIKLNANKVFGDVKKISASYSSTDTFEATLFSSSIFGGSTDSLVYPLPYPNVKSLQGLGGQDVSYNVTRSFDVSLDSAGNATIGLSGTEIFNSIDSYNYLVSVNGGSTLPTSGLSLSGTPVGKALALSYGSSYANQNVRLIATISKTNPTFKTKTLRTITESIAFNEIDRINLSNSDIYKINSVVNTDNGLDITQGFTFFDGQRANWYENGTLISKSGNITLNLSVTYQYFEHSTDGDFFCADSYNIDRADIPKTQNTSDSGSYTLADCIDFRPSKNSNGEFINVPSSFNIINPNDNLRSDLTIYLPRIDILYVSASGNYSTVSGIPSEVPKVPTIPADTMALYELYIPAYTNNVNSIVIKKYENKNYTMRDIGKLEQRIENLEYYATLSQLESKAEKTQILDPVTGNNRFKNGIAATDFTDTQLIDFFNTDFDASVDFTNGVLTSPIVQNALDLVYASGGYKHGSTVSLPYELVEFVSQPYATDTSNINPFAVFTWAGLVELSPIQDYWRDTIYNQPLVVSNVSDQTNGAVAGTTVETDVQIENSWSSTVEKTKNSYTKTTITESTEVSIQNNRVSLSVLPYMRGIEIQFKLQCFKPLTRVYPFFSSINVSSVCKPTNGEYGDAIVTDINGSASGTFKVPTEESFRFLNGRNILKFTDSPTNSDDVNNTFTQGEGIFMSGGELDTRQITTVNTKVLRAEQTKWDTTNYRVIWSRDPIAQTFSINKEGGGFIKAVDIFFKTKAKSIPVTLQIREVNTGIPSNVVITFGEVILTPDMVNISNDGSVATRFNFSDPVYLEKDKEYAIVLLADTQEYNVFIARVGEVDLTGTYVVAKQPASGVFFQSSNGTTWTPNQLEDLKFTVHGCKFVSNSTALINTKDPSFVGLEYNPLYSTTGSNTVKVNCIGHGLKRNDNVTISGVVNGNGLNSDLLNKTHKVIDSSVNSFTISLDSVATVTGAFGGGSILIQCNAPYDFVCPWLASLVLDGTSLKMNLNSKLQSTRVAATITGLESDTGTKLSETFVSGIDNKPSLELVLSTDNQWLSPLVDLDGAGLELIGHCINQDKENVIASGTTKVLKFNNPSTAAKIFMVGTVPYGSSVVLKYQALTSGDDSVTDDNWITVEASSNFKNSSTEQYEAVYDISTLNTFLGLKLKIEMFADSGHLSPELTELRLIALA